MGVNHLYPSITTVSIERLADAQVMYLKLTPEQVEASLRQRARGQEPGAGDPCETRGGPY